MGTLGFLLPFREGFLRLCRLATKLTRCSLTDIDDYTKAIDSAFAGRITVLHRMRLSCSFQDSGGERIDTRCEGMGQRAIQRRTDGIINHARPSDWQVMNEVALHRGSSPHLNTIDVYVDGQHLTEAVVR